jgi:hypothetical protein
MKRFLIKINCLIIAFVTFSCSSQGNIPGNTTSNTPNKLFQLPDIKGFVDFGPGKFSTKASGADIVKNGATVSLINQETGKAIAVGLTTPTGEFFLISNYKVPVTPAEVIDKFLILEASRRFPDTEKGNLISLRTLIKLRSSDYKFESITGTDIHGINSITTAIGILVLKNQINVLNDVLSKVQISPNDPTNVTNVSDIGAVSANFILNVKTEVENILLSNADPVTTFVKGAGSGGNGENTSCTGAVICGGIGK